MPTSTTNYELIKPGTDDPILIEQLNTNADIIDNALKENADALGGKVDKETGKGLSTNDYTTAEKTKLDGLAEIKSIGTGLNLDSSTGELTATGGGGGGGTSNYNDLTNKPQINSVTLSGNKSLSDLGITYESETAASGGTALSLVTTGEKYAWNNKQNTISDLSTIRSGAALGATAVQPETGKGLSTNDYTTAEKNKLAGIEVQANKTTVDDALNDSSTNPVQNKVVKAALDNKADTADIPTVPITAIQKNGTGITPVSGTVNITVPTTAADVSALPDTTKYAAALSLTINSSTFVMTGQLKDQNGDNLGTTQTIDLPLESVVVGGSYNSQTKKVVLTLQNGNTIEFSVADLVSGLQTELSASNKLNPAYINYDSTHRAVSDTEKSTWNGKQNALSSTQLAAVNSGIDSAKVDQIETNKNNISKDEVTIAELVEANRRKVYANTENNTSYTFSNLYGLNESRFKYALVFGGGTANNPALAMAWFVFIDDYGVVTTRKIIGDSPRTLAGSVSGTTLTLTSDSTMYGGLRLIWLS